MNEFGAELDEVLLSVQGSIDRAVGDDGETVGSPHAAEHPARVAHGDPARAARHPSALPPNGRGEGVPGHPVEGGDQDSTDDDDARDPAVRWRREFEEIEALVDPHTGAGTALALHRDVNRELVWESAAAPPFALLALSVEPEPAGTGALKPAVTFEVIKCLVEVGPFVLRGRDRVYRTAPNELTIMLAGADLDGARVAGDRLASAIERVLRDRGLPPVRLAGRLVDPARLLDPPSD